MMLNKTFHLLLLLLIPILGFSQANSQYPDSGNKIRLGFQTTADGLIWRDTQPNVGVYQPINNKAAWVVLDTVNNKLYHYKNSAWTLVGGDTTSLSNRIDLRLKIADTTNMLSPYWRADRFSGILPVANGGTGSATQNFVDLTTNQTVGGLKTFSNIFTSTATVNAVFAATESGTAARYLNIRNTSGGFLAGTEGSAGGFLIAGLPAYYGTIVSRAGLGISANDGTTNHMTILSGGNVGIGTDNPTFKLDVNGTGRFSGTTRIVNAELLLSSGYAITFDGAISGANPYIYHNSGANTLIITNNSTNGLLSIGNVNGNLSFASTGVATFSSSVTANQINSIVTSGTARVTIGNNLISGGSLLNLSGISGGKTWFVSGNYNIGGALEFLQSTTNGGTTPASTAVFSLSSTGEATFSSSVTAGGAVSITGNFPIILNSISGVTSQQLQYRNNGTNKWQLYLNTDDNSYNIFNSTNATNRLTILENGNVGIGTTAPQSLLQVGSISSATLVGPTNWNQVARFTSTNNKTSIVIQGSGTGVSTNNQGLPAIEFDPYAVDASGRIKTAIVAIDNYFGYRKTDLAFVLDSADDLNPWGISDTKMIIKNGGNVGIGTTTPSGKLNIVGGLFPLKIEPTTSGTDGVSLTMGYNGLIYNSTAPSYKTFTIQNALNDAIADTYLLGGGGTGITIKNTGNVGIGTTTASYTAENRGNLTIGGVSSSIFAFQTNNIDRSYLYHNGTDFSLVNNSSGGGVYISSNGGGVVLSSAATSWASSSDERLKNINYIIENAVSKLSSLRTVNFSWKSDQTKKEYLGLIAQDVEKVFPQVISKNNLHSNIDDVQIDSTEYLSVRYTELIPVLVKAIQELSAQVDILKQEIINLKNK